MIGIVKRDGTLRGRKFMCLETNQTYVVAASESTFTGTKFWEDSVYKVNDTVVRTDGAQRTLSRERMARRFKNVRMILEPITELPKKRKKKKEVVSNNYKARL